MLGKKENKTKQKKQRYKRKGQRHRLEPWAPTVVSVKGVGFERFHSFEKQYESGFKCWFYKLLIMREFLYNSI